MQQLFALLIVLLASTGKAQTHFPSSPLIEGRAKFWERIFTEYSSDEMVIHDIEQPELILGSCAKGDNCQIYEQILTDFAARGNSARHESNAHYRVWQLYRKSAKAHKRLLRGDVRTRGQGGLSDVFLKAAATAELYLPQMEKIFRQHGLPPELTRIVFVESMFNLKARSKVGASGIWQLMPATARTHIKVNRRIDERNSPLRATQAAAKILKSNKQQLGNWPLAITAYNHGVNGVKRGVAQTGSRHLSDLITSYRSPSFGFASSNFYAEFLAAKRAFQQYKQKKTSLSALP